MTKSEAGRLGGASAKRRHRFTKEEARAAGKKSAEARRCPICRKVPSRGESHECGGSRP